MFYVPLYLELLRSRPQLVFWFAALAQAAIWLVVPAAFYFAPPGDLAQLLAIGHEFRFNSGVGPPLAYWLGEYEWSDKREVILWIYFIRINESFVCVLVCVASIARQREIFPHDAKLNPS